MLICALRSGGDLACILLSILLLTLSFAPFSQFYLAWVGLVPFLLLLTKLQSQRSTFLWGWIAGILFFTANMWWLVYVTGPGMIALMLLLGLFWAFCAVLIRGAGLLHRPWLAILLIPSVWVGFEWFRGNWPLEGLPWLFLGHSQSPFLAICQIADVTGAYGISFVVVAINVLIALAIPRRKQLRQILPQAAAVAGMLVVVLSYGIFRLNQNMTSPGPAVMVVQSNFPQKNTEKGASYEEFVEFHVVTTRAALQQRGSDQPAVDLAVWSETTMPNLDADYIALLDRSIPFLKEEERSYRIAERAFLSDVRSQLERLSADYRISILAGGHYSQIIAEGNAAREERRNVAYFISNGKISDKRYDKIHLVPFGEYLPFRDSIPPLYRLFLSLSPYEDDYTLAAGSLQALTTFTLDGASGKPVRFVTPICFEDIDPSLVAKMFRGKSGKSADLIVNVTNDGWFQFNQMPQHFQVAIFRSIENRVPTARSVNTGISGFIDSNGRVIDTIPAGTAGAKTMTVQLDSRYTLYTRHGDLFAGACVLTAGGVMIVSLAKWSTRRKKRA